MQFRNREEENCSKTCRAFVTRDGTEVTWSRHVANVEDFFFVSSSLGTGGIKSKWGYVSKRKEMEASMAFNAGIQSYKSTYMDTFYNEQHHTNTHIYT
jgi:hypothetical protein